MPDTRHNPDSSATDTAEQARAGMLTAVTGKAKEMAGALTGNDELTEEGQLQQAQAAAQREATTTDALAEAQAEQATDHLHNDKQHAQQQRHAAAAAAEDRTRHAVAAAASEQARIEAEAAQREQAEQIQVRKQGAAELARNAEQAQHTRAAADAHERDAQHRHDQLLGEADAELDRAAQLRRHANALGTGTDTDTDTDTDLEGPR
jgi:uncharacterized protein YjbJ (UPF0337 family)